MIPSMSLRGIGIGIACLLVACAPADPPEPVTPTRTAAATPPAASEAPPSPTATATADEPEPEPDRAPEPEPEPEPAPKRDASIDLLVADLEAKPMWQNGGFPRLDLPRTASVPDVVAMVLTKVGFDAGRVKTHRILETHEVGIGEERYTAVLLDTDLGRKIMLLRYGSPSGWWSRVFDAAGAAR
jgi:hypothetical protein